MSQKRSLRQILLGIIIGIVTIAIFLKLIESDIKELAPKTPASSSHSARLGAHAQTAKPSLGPERRARFKWTEEAVEQRRRKWQQLRAKVRSMRRSRMETEASRPEAARADDERRFHEIGVEQIKDAMNEINPLLVECYENALLDAGPGLEGKLVIEYEIGGEPSVGGVIEDAAIDVDRSGDLAANASLAQCVTETIYSLEFDAPPTGGRMAVTFPLVFSKAEKEEAPENEP